jgi:hypothetical protein
MFDACDHEVKLALLHMARADDVAVLQVACRPNFINTGETVSRHVILVTSRPNAVWHAFCSVLILGFSVFQNGTSNDNDRGGETLDAERA